MVRTIGRSIRTEETAEVVLDKVLGIVWVGLVLDKVFGVVVA